MRVARALRQIEILAVLAVAGTLAGVATSGCASRDQRRSCEPGSGKCSSIAAKVLPHRYADGRTWCLLFSSSPRHLGLPGHARPSGSLLAARYEPTDRVEYWTGCERPGPDGVRVRRLQDPAGSPATLEEEVLGFLDPATLERQGVHPVGPKGRRSSSGIFSGRLPTGEAITYVLDDQLGRIVGVLIATHAYRLEDDQLVSDGEPCSFDYCEQRKQR
jgi:hypothetical protein